MSNLGKKQHQIKSVRNVKSKPGKLESFKYDHLKPTLLNWS